MDEVGLINKPSLQLHDSVITEQLDAHTVKAGLHWQLSLRFLVQTSKPVTNV